MSTRYVITNFSYKENQYLGLMIFDEHKLIKIRAITSEDIVGGIYAGKISKISKDGSYCFINISKDTAVYLTLNESTKPIYVNKQSKKEGPHEGDTILIQIEKSAIKSKPASATTNISIAGRYTVITSKNGDFSISSRINKSERESLKSSLSDLTSDDYGIIIRTEAFGKPVDLVRAEIQKLSCEFRRIMDSARNADSYSVVKKPLPSYVHFLLEEGIENIEQIITDLPKIYKDLEIYCESLNIRDKLSFYSDEYSISKLYSITSSIDRITKRLVHLESGGSIVIDQTESLTAIDVNMANGQKRRDREANILSTNIEAAKEIAYQIKARNISGIIIIDFIDMNDELAEQKLKSKMEEYTLTDKTKVNVVDITKLGLMEITRKRIYKSLKEQLNEICISNNY